MKIYLDNAATTPVDVKVAEKVKEFFLNNYGNASSLHKLGAAAREEIERVREKVARFINCSPDEIVFTSGGTESNNLAVKGVALANPEKKHIITSVFEHPSILETCRELEKRGYDVDYVSVNGEGFVDVVEIEKKISRRTLIVSIMHVNNEIGTIQDLKRIGKICKKHGVYFHSDCVQSFGKIKIDVKDLDLDFISVSGHKINAPKGVGFLYIKSGIKILPIILGGGQEFGLRSGTENAPGIAGLGVALDLDRKAKEIKKIRNYILEEILKIPGSRLNGSLENRIYNNINVSFYGIEGESLVLLLDKAGIWGSTGSACSSHKLEESHVLKAINTPDLYIHGSLRLTLGKINIKEADYVVEEVKEAVGKLREISLFKLKGNVKNEKNK